MTDISDHDALDRLAQRLIKQKVNVQLVSRPGDVAYLTPVVIAYVDTADPAKGTVAVTDPRNVEVVATTACPGVYDVWIDGHLEAGDLNIGAAASLLAAEYRDFKTRYWTQRRSASN
jgi:hypothetical protein